MSLTPTNKHNHCPICEDTSGKCRQGREDQDYWLCMSFADIQKGQIHNGFKCIGHTRDRLWGQFKLDNSQEWSEQQRQDWQRENQRRQNEQASENEQRRRRSLTAEQRHEQYSRLLNELTLHPDDRADLVRRGFTHEQIELSGFKSIGRYQQLQSRYSDLLPGISRGNRLIIADDGYLCPVRNADGLIVACQVRLRSLPNTETNRYRWLNGGNQTLHLYPEGCKGEGELPLAVFRPEGKPEGIALVEGTGAKPLLVSQRLNLFTIGAAGGQWASSLELLKEDLEKGVLEAETLTIRLFPDAGDILNPSVMTRWQRIIALLEEWGWEVAIGWWNQKSKEDCDVDELPPERLNEILYITPAEFLSFAESTEPAQSKPATGFKVVKKIDATPVKKVKKVTVKAVEPEDETELIQRKLRSLNIPVDFQITTRYIPKDLDTKLPQSGIINLIAPKGSGKSTLIPKYIDQQKRLGRIVISIVPRILLGLEQSFSWKISWIDQTGIALEQSSDELDKKLEPLIKQRQALEHQLKEAKQIKLGETPEDIDSRIQDLKSQIDAISKEIENIKLASVKSLALCWDSLWKIQNSKLRECCIIIDEAEQGFSHLATSSTCRNKRGHILYLFSRKIKECLETGGVVLLSDADLSNVAVDYVRELAPKDIRVTTIRSDYRGEETKWQVTLTTGSPGNTWNQIVEYARNGYHFVVTSDSQRKLQALEELIIRECPEFCRFLDKEGNVTPEAQERIDSPLSAQTKPLIVRIDSTTTETQFGKDFVKNINGQIKHWKPRILLYSPSMGTGVSIKESTQRQTAQGSIPYFDCVFGLFYGVLEPSQCRQQLARVRANVPRFIYCKDRGMLNDSGCKSFNPEVVKSKLLRYRESAVSIIDLAKAQAQFEWGDDVDDEQIREKLLEFLTEKWDEKSKRWDDPHLNLYAKLMARRNYSLSYLAKQLKAELELEGHDIFDYEGSKNPIMEKVKEISDEQLQERADEISSANPGDMSVKEARQIERDPAAKREDRVAAAKVLLQDRIPNVPLTKEFVFEKILKNRAWLNAQQMYYYCQNLDAVKEKDERGWLYQFKEFSLYVYQPDNKSTAPKVKAILESGIFDFVDVTDPNRVYTGDSEEATQFIQKVFQASRNLSEAFDMKLSSQSKPIRIANSLLEKVGLKLVRLTKAKSDNRYKLCEKRLNDPDRLAVLAAFDVKRQQALEEKAKREAERLAVMQAYQERLQREIEQAKAIEMRREELTRKREFEKATGTGLYKPLAEVQEEIHLNQQSPETQKSDIELLIDKLELCQNADEFRALANTYNSEMIEDAILFASNKYQLKTWQKVEISTENSIKIGDVVEFFNPDNLPGSKQFENLALKVINILAGSLAFCLLPDGNEASFGVRTLRRSHDSLNPTAAS